MVSENLPTVKNELIESIQRLSSAGKNVSDSEINAQGFLVRIQKRFTRIRDVKVNVSNRSMC